MLPTPFEMGHVRRSWDTAKVLLSGGIRDKLRGHDPGKVTDVTRRKLEKLLAAHPEIAATVADSALPEKMLPAVRCLQAWICANVECCKVATEGVEGGADQGGEPR